MTLARWQGFIQNDVGDTVSGVSVTVKHEADQVNANIYSDASGTTSISNPLTSQSDGFAEFYSQPGEMRITAQIGGDTADFRNVNVEHSVAPVVTVTGNSYTLSETDIGNYVRLTNASSCDVTLPTALGHAFEEIHVRGVNAGTYTVVSPGVTVNLPSGGTAVIQSQGGTVTLKRVALNEWDMIGLTVSA